MHIFINNKKLSFSKYRVKCSIGKRGIGIKKREGDKITPRGKFKIDYILYRNDRVSNIDSSIKKRIIKKNMGWCDDPNSKDYNKLKIVDWYILKKYLITYISNIKILK